MVTIEAKNFHLQHTLESGQLFRYEKTPEGYLVSHGERAFLIRQEGETLFVLGSTPTVTDEWLRHFFALDETVPMPTDAYSAAALEYCGGMRICNQQPFECLIGFICSQNNNVKRIRALMQGLARAFGERVSIGPYETFLFPQPGSILDNEDFRALKAGYREAYILAANTVTHEILEGINGHPYEDAKTMLQTIPGVGPKVADCILLFAYGHEAAFPIDTWVEQIMRTHYGCEAKKDMRSKANQLWGDRAGVMQQYLFHYARTA